ncbi:unnamed protein product [Brassica oleracea]
MEVNKITVEKEKSHHDDGRKQISMERVELPQLHEHPLIPFNRFVLTQCKACNLLSDDYGYIYGGYRCNELGCEEIMFHKECFKPLKEINHSFHPNLLKLIIPTLPLHNSQSHTCFCGYSFKAGYCCKICDFKLDLKCARRSNTRALPVNSYGHEHLFKIVSESYRGRGEKICKACGYQECDQYVTHVDCVDFFPEAYHTSHPQHPLKSRRGQVPDYADKKCLLCEKGFRQFHLCDVCNYSICSACMRNPPPLNIQCLKTHEHQLHLFSRLIDFTCNACGTQGSRSPYLCPPCNFIIHRECIDLPRVISINRHDHRISYTPHLGHRKLKCRVCRKEVDGFYGAYTCSKCPSFAAHARCATRRDVWDMVEREGTPEEEEIAPYEVIDDNTIRHFSHTIIITYKSTRMG